MADANPMGWTVEGPGRCYDYSVFPATDAGARAALDCAQEWLEEAVDHLGFEGEEGEVKVTVRFGPVDHEDLEDSDA